MTWNDVEREDTLIYTVVVNHEEQYSIWPGHKEIPLGWKQVGKTGLKAECLAYIKEVWTDMRPSSLRRKMEELAEARPLSPPVRNLDGPRENSLVNCLCEGFHPVEVGMRTGTIKLFKEAIDRNYIHVKFTQTQGGTELGLRLKRDTSDLSGGDFENGAGIVHIEGSLTLDYVKVKCAADIDLSTLKGTGRLEKV